MLYDRGDGVGAMPAAQLAELAGHPRVAILLGGIAGWPEELVAGQVELEKNRATFEPRLDALPTRAELATRLDDPGLTILDVRRKEEFRGRSGYPCDPRQGHIPGARLLEYTELYAGPGLPRPADEIRGLLGLADEAEIVPYCHSGSRSALATLALWQLISPAARRRKRLANGLCLRCGYDLRASAARCPECGTPVPAGHVTAA